MFCSIMQQVVVAVLAEVMEAAMRGLAKEEAQVGWGLEYNDGKHNQHINIYDN